MGRYDCFILRVWRSLGEDGEQWAARVEHVSGAEALRFGDPEALLQYLRERIAPDRGAAGLYRYLVNEERDTADERRVDNADM